MTRTLALGWLSLACVAAGCAREPDRLSIAVETDLTPVVELSWLEVQLLDPQHDELVLNSRWLEVTPGCSAGPDGQFALGSWTVNESERPLAAQRVIGYRSERGHLVQVADQRFNAQFHDQTSPLIVTLARACSGVSCAPRTTCEPRSASCQDIPTLAPPTATSSSTPGDCLHLRDAAPPLQPLDPVYDASAAIDATFAPEASTLDATQVDDASGFTSLTPDDAAPDATISAMRCMSDDGVCPPGCDSLRDQDCRLAITAACGPTTDACVAGAYCRHGFCCDAPCGDPCTRCDLPGQVGHCSPILYSAIEGPLSDPGFAVSCVPHHISVQCTGGKCSHACDDGFDSCDTNLDNGCETKLGTPEHCGSCKDACPYGYCERTCVWHHTSNLATSGSTSLAAGSLYAMPLVRTSEDTKVRALGALVDPTIVGKRVRLSLYSRDPYSLTPYKLLVQTDDLMVVDAEKSEIPKSSSAIRVEQTVAADIPLGESYFIAIQASEKVQLYGDSERSVIWTIAARPYGEFPTFYPVTTIDSEAMTWSIYAITTPK